MLMSMFVSVKHDYNQWYDIDMKQKFAVFDIDGTLFRWQLFHELVFELSSMGLFPTDVSKKLEYTFSQWRGLHATWAEYETEIINAVQGYITTIDPKDLEAAAAVVVERSGHKLYAYTSNLAKSLKKQGYLLIAMSGSQQEIVEIFAKKHGFDYYIGMVLERSAEDTYTGKFERFVVDKKGVLLTNFIAEHDLSLDGSYAVGDSDGDIPMLELVEHPIAFNPSSELYEAAISKHWPIVLERKDMSFRLEWRKSGYVLAETEELS